MSEDNNEPQFAESAAKKIAEEVGRNCHEQQVGIGEWKELQRTWEGKTSQEVWNEAVCHCAEVLFRDDTVKKIAPIITDEFKPLMEVLRIAVRSVVQPKRHRRNEWIECSACGGAGETVETVGHTSVCWVSRAQKILGE